MEKKVAGSKKLVNKLNQIKVKTIIAQNENFQCSKNSPELRSVQLRILKVLQGSL